MILPAVTRAVPPPAPTFTGPPAAFIGADLTGTSNLYLKLDLARAGRFTGLMDIEGKGRNVLHGTLDVPVPPPASPLQARLRIGWRSPVPRPAPTRLPEAPGRLSSASRSPT